MPIALQIFHPDRMLIGIVRGTVTPLDLDGFVAEIVAAKALRYRKIIDVMGASSGLTAEGLIGVPRARPPDGAAAEGARWPIALVADKELA